MPFFSAKPYALLEGSYPSRRASERLKAYIEAVSARRKVTKKRSLLAVSEHFLVLFNAAETT
jgi:hypothetical protein